MDTANGHAAPVTLTPLRLPQENTPNGTERPRTPPNKRERRRADGTAFIVVALFAVAQVAVVAFSGSWQHQYELSIHLGQAHWVAGMQPLSVEGLIVSASLVIWYAARYGYRKRDAWAAYLVLAAGVGQTVLMNLGADYRWPWLGPEISVWPAVAFVAAYEMAVWLVRKRQDASAAPVVTPRHDSDDDSRDDKPQRKPATRKPAPAMTKQASIADVIRDNPGLTNAELAALAGCKVRTIQRHKPKTGNPT
jgi:nitrate reductase NapE component